MATLRKRKGSEAQADKPFLIFFWGYKKNLQKHFLQVYERDLL
jgi:hypothetical protein